jgi:hypothetical protein
MSRITEAEVPTIGGNEDAPDKIGTSYEKL